MIYYFYNKSEHEIFMFKKAGREKAGTMSLPKGTNMRVSSVHCTMSVLIDIYGKTDV